MWYIGYLLRKSEEIKTNFTEEDNVFSDLIELEKGISSICTDKEKNIINYIVKGEKLDKEIGGRYAYTLFLEICNKIENQLEYFSDESFLNRMKEDYDLDPVSMEKVREYINQAKRAGKGDIL